MTVQPFRTLPAPGAVPGGTAAAPVAGHGAQGFMALLLAALPGAGAGAPGASADPAAGPGPTPAEDALAGLPGAPGTETADPTDSPDGADCCAAGDPTVGAGHPTDPAVLAALALGVPAGLRPTDAGTGPLGATAAQASATAAAATDGPDLLPGSVSGAGQAPQGDEALLPAGTTRPGESGSGQPGTLRLPDGLGPGGAGGPGGPGGSGGPGGTADPGAQLPGTAEGAPAPTLPAEGAQPSSAGGAATSATAPAAQAAPIAPVAPTTPIAPAAPAAAPGPMGDSAPSAEVTRQVFPEIGRLVTRGDGTHRLTMTLNPAALGDVHVTLTVRHGAVTVSFAAADQAQAALLEGTPELRRLLESVGASETRVLVRDLPGSGLPDPAGGQSQERHGSQGREAPTDKHAGTRAEQPATDGSARGPGSTPTAHDPATRRPGGVDVTV